jgi:hypothetical protein
MKASDSFIVVERMIRHGELRWSELEHLLEILVGQEHITVEECRALLDLATKLNVDQQASGSDGEASS